MNQANIGSIMPQKHNCFYRYFHPYFTKLAPNVVDSYIKHFTKPSDIVLDPFCGSGVVGIETLLNNRISINSDLSPLACLITKELQNTKMKISGLDFHFQEIKKICLPLINKIWSYGSTLHYTRTNKYFEKLKKAYWYPTNKLSYRSNIESIDKLFDIRQLLTYAVLFDYITNEIKNKNIQNTFLVIFFGTMSRANLTYMVSATRSGSVLHNGGSSLFSIYDYRKPKNIVVIPVWDRFVRKYNDVKKIKEIVISKLSKLPDQTIKSSKVYKADVSKIHYKLESNSVDYIFTDPPYGGKIPYLELASMWSSWLKWDISQNDLESEIIEGGELNKTSKDYLSLMKDAFKSMSIVLKVGGHLSLVFQHNDLAVWEHLLSYAKQNNLKFIGSSIQPTNSSSLIKKKFEGKILSVPLIMNFVKTNTSKNLPHKSKWLDIKKVHELVETEIKKNYNKKKITYELLYNLITQIFFDNDLSFNSNEIKSVLNACVSKYNIISLVN